MIHVFRLILAITFLVSPFAVISSSTSIDSILNLIDTSEGHLNTGDQFHLYSELNEEYKNQNDLYNYVETSIKMADLCRSAGSLHIGLELINDLVDSRIEMEPAQKIHICVVKGSILYELSRHEDAIYWGLQGLALGIKFDNHQFDALLNNLVGAGYLNSTPDSGIKYFNLSAEQFLAQNDSSGAVLPLINLSRLYSQKQEFEKALEILNQSIEVLDKKDVPVYRKMVFSNYAYVYRETKQFEKSTTYLGLRDSVNFEINNNVNKFQVSQYQKRIEDAEKAKELMVLANQIDMAEMQNQNNKIIIGLSILSILALGVGMFIVVRISRKRKQITKSLAKKAKELETVNNFKNQVLSVISHDMRSPLAQIITFQHAKNSGINFSPKELKEMDKTIMASAKNGLLILDNLLKWASHQFSGEKVSKSTFESKFILNQLINQVSEMAKEKEVVIHADLVETDIHTNESLFQIVIRNLLNNAIKFSPLHSEIRISTVLMENHLEVKIIDQGPGIPEKIISDINSGKTIKPKLGSLGEKGAGIGLTFSKEFAQRIDASFEFTPDMLVGTEVTFNVPIGKD